MGGAIGVTSEPGRGSTFHFTVRLETRPASADRNAIPRVDMAGRRALLAIPNVETRASVAEMMAPLALAVRAVADGEGAIAALRERVTTGGGSRPPGAPPFDVVLLDASLPGTAELMRVLDGDEALSTVPVLLLAYPGQRWDDGATESRTAITLGGSARLPATGRTGTRAWTRVVSGLAKPVRQAHLHASLCTLMGSAMEQVAPAPESRRAGPPPSRRVASQQGRGTSPSTRSGETPRAPEVAPAPSPAAPTLVAGEGRPKVLLVEDNAVNQRVARLMMEKRGYEVDVAGDGYEAVEATARTRYAAVLMDCHMPRFDGYSATREIRDRDALKPRVPIIAMTANAGPGARERCLAAGMDDYIAKPVSAEAIDEVLRSWVPRAPAAPPPSRARSSTPPPVDLGMLRKLRVTQSAGEPDIVAEVIALFLQDAPGRVAAIREAVTRGDLAGAARTAHTLKGSAGHLGAKTLGALCARFEEKVRGGAAFNVTFAVTAIADELERVRVALAAEPRSERGRTISGPGSGP
jgi:CheY-like chemotaxis protein